MDKIFEIQRTVDKNHIDELGHVNNVVYLQWVQDIANMHWSQLKEGYDTSDFVWVVLRHEIDYLGQAFLGDILTVKTWVGETEGIKSIRHVQIEKDKKPIVKVATTWCLVDSQSMRPRRINGDILKILQQHQ